MGGTLQDIWGPLTHLTGCRVPLMSALESKEAQNKFFFFC